jgi:Precorrin-2 methylase
VLARTLALGDPNVYSTFGHLRRTVDAFHPDVNVETVPKISATAVRDGTRRLAVPPADAVTEAAGHSKFYCCQTTASEPSDNCQTLWESLSY